jgi:aspartyl protease family protein
MGFMVFPRAIRLGHSIAALALVAAVPVAQATDVGLAGLLPGKALVVIDGGRPRSVPVGVKTPEGVKLVAIEDGAAVFEVDGKRLRLVMGQHSVSTGGGAGQPTVTLTANGRGSFYGEGSINGASMHFLVDTGATFVAVGIADANRAGIDYQQGQPITMSTANGFARAWRMPGAAVRLGEILLYDVVVVVHEAPMPYALLGMSFLNRVEMKRDGDTMTLKKRY